MKRAVTTTLHLLFSIHPSIYLHQATWQHVIRRRSMILLCIYVCVCVICFCVFLIFFLLYCLTSWWINALKHASLIWTKWKSAWERSSSMNIKSRSSVAIAIRCFSQLRVVHNVNTAYASSIILFCFIFIYFFIKQLFQMRIMINN